KSACPGVSTMLTLCSRQRIDVFFDRIVIPRSRSRGFESMTRSSTTWLSRKAPAWRSILSTRVVLPWSTCAMMAMLRIMYRIVRVSCTALENNGTRGLDGTPQFTGRARVEGEGERSLRAEPGEGGASAGALAGWGRGG